MECEICDKEVCGNPDIHHIDGDRKNNSINNLILVCIKCHKIIHHPIKVTRHKYKPKELYLLKKYCGLLFESRNSKKKSI
tara:strand:- start:95 stop:334 length:240 start_codon:yes stop_codon:yes gene_type:complete